MKFKYNDNFSDINSAYLNTKSGFDFHKKSKQYLYHFSNTDFIIKVFLKNFDKIISDNSNNFMPTFTFFNNENFQLRYNFILNNELLNSKQGSHLIHHHGENILTSQLIYGDGYDSIIFKSIEKGVINNNLKPLETKPHRFGNIYTINSYVPHLIFNVEEFTVTCNLWSNSHSNSEIMNRVNYIYSNGVYLPITEEDFNSNLNFISNDYLLLKCFLYWFKKINLDIEYLCSKKPSLIKYLDYLEFKNWTKKDQPSIRSLNPVLGYHMNYDDILDKN